MAPIVNPARKHMLAVISIWLPICPCRSLCSPLNSDARDGPHAGALVARGRELLQGLEDHLARAHWMTRCGYRQLLEDS